MTKKIIKNDSKRIYHTSVGPLNPNTSLELPAEEALYLIKISPKGELVSDISSLTVNTITENAQLKQVNKNLQKQIEVLQEKINILNKDTNNEDDEKNVIKEQLDKLGCKYHHKMGLTTLQELLATKTELKNDLTQGQDGNY